MKITVLGCGSSLGVPALRYGWGDCDSDNPKNKRTRSSIIIEEDGFILLVDSSPDVREQLLAYGIEKIDALLYTHAHFDHVNGIDELKSLFISKNLDVFATRETLLKLKRSFPYVFKDLVDPDSFESRYAFIEAHEIKYGKFNIKGMEGICFPQNHGNIQSLGFRIKNFAYSTDVKELGSDMVANLQNLDIWIVACLCQGARRSTHGNLEDVIKWVEELRPQKTYLTHMDTSMDYDTLKKILPHNIEPAYDQMTIEI